jgi:predicted NBD/HSP70 family sugar kinase
LGKGLEVLINVFDPEVVVLAGGSERNRFNLPQYD